MTSHYTLSIDRFSFVNHPATWVPPFQENRRPAGPLICFLSFLVLTYIHHPMIGVPNFDPYPYFTSYDRFGGFHHFSPSNLWSSQWKPGLALATTYIRSDILTASCRGIMFSRMYLQYACVYIYICIYMYLYIYI